MTTTTTAPAATPENVANIADASNARWLAARVERARLRVANGPTDEAVARIRARVFGDAAQRKKDRSIAA